MSGQALTVDYQGKMRLVQILQPKQYKACSFERIYFSRGSDIYIMRERNSAADYSFPDWYFSGDYPTPGGTKRLNAAFINYYETEYSNTK